MADTVLVSVPVAFALVALAGIQLVPGRRERAGVLVGLGAGLALLLGLGIGVVLTVDQLDAPGGAAGVALVAAWAVPLAALVALARRRPALALPVLAVTATAPVLLAGWAALEPTAWRTWSGAHGPVLEVTVLVVGVAVAVLGLARPLAATLLLLVTTVAPVLLLGVAAGTQWPTMTGTTVVALPLAVVALLDLWAGLLLGLPRPALRRPGLLPHRAQLRPVPPTS